VTGKENQEQIWPGSPRPLGAHYDGDGTNFSLFSESAIKVELCLFDDDGTERRLSLPEVTAHCWHGYVPEVRPGQRYGYRVHGDYDPASGDRSLPGKLLLDPYARAIDGEIDWNEAVFTHRFDDPDGPPNDADSAAYVPRSVVTDDSFDWNGDWHPNTPWHRTVIYELHVRGFTKTHPDIPEELRGTYAGLAHPAAIEHLHKLGVTAVELLPVHEFIHDHALVERGLRNYWGYNSIGYFAPHADYASSKDSRGGQVIEFKKMVKALHAAGIEVLLDVVYNHTGEGSHRGPSLCFRGIDNRAYYRTDPNDRSRYIDYTGCGNSMNMRNPHVLQLIMDSLRYWVEHMHVDGFRFDLAATLARELHAVDRLSAFFDIIQQDPILQQVKLIAEPWDLGEGGYQVGNFPPLWSEWNGKYRDTVRAFWRGEDQTLAEFANRFTGSSDLYESSARRPHASINFVTSHDGFTLGDLVTYEKKCNLANGEDNRDGDNHNGSWNCGVEGTTDDEEINELRRRQQRNFLTTLFLSQGVPMLCAGDELGRTQRGNNNAYCQDNAISWIDWEARDNSLLNVVQTLIELRNAHPVLRRRRWFQGKSIRGTEHHDIAWLRPDGSQMSDDDWNTSFAKSLAVFLNGDLIASRDPRGRQVVDDSFLVLFNAADHSVSFTMAEALPGQWQLVLDTAAPQGGDESHELLPPSVSVEARAIRLYRRRRAD
jgi:glycogen operon protein